jgi:hypothetical protein
MKKNEVPNPTRREWAQASAIYILMIMFRWTMTIMTTAMTMLTINKYRLYD